jgi:hypothetical protein
MATIEDLLKSMLTLPKKGEAGTSNKLDNSKDTWERIGNGDSFAELNFSSDTEKNEFLQDWIQNNPYTNI